MRYPPNRHGIFRYLFIGPYKGGIAVAVFRESVFPFGVFPRRRFLGNCNDPIAFPLYAKCYLLNCYKIGFVVVNSHAPSITFSSP